jgi:hypothetical protein
VFKGYRYFLQFSSVQIHFTALCWNSKIYKYLILLNSYWSVVR